jgi:polar amino acid transport system permease protein
METRQEDANIKRASIVDGVGSLVKRAEIPWASILVTLGFVAFLAVLWVLLAIVGGSSTIQPYHWDFNVVTPYLGAIAQGLQLTLTITLITILLGMALGIIVAGARLSSVTAVRVITTAYIEIMRGTPTLVQLFWVYYALPIVTGVQLPAFESVVLALVLNVGAFYGEAFRSGIQAIPREQVETADVLGLRYAQRMRYVIVPQAFRIVLPVLISISISLFKDTSLVSTIGVNELFYTGRTISTDTYRPLEVFTAIAVVYFIIAFPVTVMMRRIEIYLSRHLAQER